MCKTPASLKIGIRAKGIPRVNAGELPEMDLYEEVGQQGQVEDQPYADDASSTAESPGNIDDSDSMEEDTNKDSIDYPVELEDGDEDDDEDPKEDHTEENKPEDEYDDDDTDDEDKEPTKDEEEEEHIALADSFAVPIVDPVPSARDTEVFETDESAPTPRSPQTRYHFFSPDHLLLEEFADELALITFPPGNDDLPFDIESDLREIEYLLNHDPTKEMDSILEDSVDEGNLADPNNDLVDTIPEMFTDEHTLDYSSPPLYDDVDDDLVELESDNDDVYDDPFDSKEDKIKESKLLIDELDPPRSSDFLPSPKCDSVLYKDFSEVDALPSTNNEDKVFNPGILIHENLFEVTIRATPDKNVKKTTNASLILEDFNPPLYELPFHKEVPGSETLLSFSSENEEKVFNPGILTSKGVHTSLLPELSHRGPKAFKVIKIFESPMEIFPCSYGEDIRVLDVPSLALLEASPSSSQNPKTFQPKNKGLVYETFDWDEEEVFDEEEVTQGKVLMALTDDELTVGKSHARNGEWVDITMRKVNTLLSMDEDADWQIYLKYISIDLKFVEEQRLNLLSKYNKMVFELNKCRDELLILKQAKLYAVTFQIQNTELIKLNHALQEQLKEEKRINEKWLTSSKNVSQCISEQIPHQKKKVLGGEMKMKIFSFLLPWVPESQAINESLETSNIPESSKDFESEFLTPLPPLKILQGASPSSKDSSNESVSGTITVSESKQTTPSVPTKVKDTKQESKLNELTKLVQMLIDEKINSDQNTQESNSKIQKAEILYCMICKREDHRTSDHEMYIASLKRSENYKAQPYQYASPSKKILRAKAKPFPPCIHCGFNYHMPNDYRNYPECEICGSYDHSTSGHNHVIQIRGGALAESSQSNESSIGVKEPICYLDSGCSRSMTGVKSYLHKYVEQPGPKVVFGDNASCITEGYGSIKCGGIVFTKVAFVNGLKYNLISISQLCDAKYIVQFNDKQGTIFNANKEIVLIAPRRNDVYVIDMSSLTPNGACFFAKASESVNWLWHKRLSHLNFKNINKLSKQNKVIGLPSLVYSKDKPCTACEKWKHHRASFKTKQNFCIKKCLHLLHMDLFGPISPMSINHEKYTLVIVDEYSRYTWVYFLRKKSQAPEMIMSFIRMVENQNDVKVKQIRTDNGTEFRNHELESFCDEKGISQNFSSPYTPEQNGVAERKNRTLIEAARTMLNGSVLSKHFWTDAVRIACYTQNRSIIVKRHDKTSYEIFRERIPDISYFHVFGCPVFIHNHKDHLGKFDAKADDGYFLGYSSISKAFRVYNTRRQQIEETYHVTFDESMEAIRFTNTLVDEIGINDSFRYPPDEFQEDDPSRQYQVDSDVSYYIIPHGRSLTEITQENHVPEVNAPNEPEIPHTEDAEGPPNPINTEGIHEQNIQNDQMITQPTDVPSENNTEVSGSITEPLV
ncbi:retrovirus-related pol polyprotein from transposon TNT 1-94 [Tanacetum coccineum]|uniref:Retrovirus-related pol polyprotein from transposon TNT 1-94 n=1 Tax=Tanacetum coccineum TaxID=301880 RepID=A0ABQ4WKC8_9ASTR